MRCANRCGRAARVGVGAADSTVTAMLCWVCAIAALVEQAWASSPVRWHQLRRLPGWAA